MAIPVFIHFNNRSTVLKARMIARLSQINFQLTFGIENIMISIEDLILINIGNSMKMLLILFRSGLLLCETMDTP